MRDGDARPAASDRPGRGSDPRDPRETAERLREELQALRESGCTILVVGEVPAEVSREACAALAGGPERELVTVETGGGCTCGGVGRDPSHTRTVRWADRARGAATTAGDHTGTDHGTVTEATTLSELGEATAAAVDRAAADTAPGELRVCIDSLGPLVEATSERSVFRFCHQLNATVRAAEGLGHVHLPVAREAERAAILGALFDVTVELDLFGGKPRQRWFLHEAGIVSDWLPIGVGDR
ncbi:hypothetical protein N0B31_19625 [Salinirubellus salinus]|uniref:Uncharacterized protein n=1 Tax=Salinirubellus salinus TaxID=1364945 RepID=A0A9E7R247_9EURY|nr:hypothetical protein [Salinirubellus salinus]UWM54314.1 hypothetical protein N0B31_19625 [Salinirubellus salinus]